MNMNHLMMKLNGYKKIALNDTKGALNKKNNYKWVKENPNLTYTVLTSGTIIEEGKGVYGNSYKKVIKPNGSMLLAQHNLPYGKFNLPVPGSYSITEHTDSKNIGSRFNPNYIPVGIKSVYKFKSPEQVIAENNEKKLKSLKKKD